MLYVAALWRQNEPMLSSISRAMVGSLAVAVMGGCGANVVFDATGAGGAGGSSASTGGGGAGGSAATGSPCDILSSTLDDTILAATACDPFLNVASCTGSLVILDTCGCPAIVANELYPERAQAAQNAYDAWVAAGCGPYPCETCIPATTGLCDPNTSRCAPVTPL